MILHLVSEVFRTRQLSSRSSAGPVLVEVDVERLFTLRDLALATAVRSQGLDFEGMEFLERGMIFRFDRRDLPLLQGRRWDWVPDELAVGLPMVGHAYLTVTPNTFGWECRFDMLDEFDRTARIPWSSLERRCADPTWTSDRCTDSTRQERRR